MDGIKNGFEFLFLRADFFLFQTNQRQKTAPNHFKSTGGAGVRYNEEKTGGAGVRYNEEKTDFIKPGSVLLSHAFRHSIITAEDFRFPVRDGMERFIPRYDHQAKQNRLDPFVIIFSKN